MKWVLNEKENKRGGEKKGFHRVAAIVSEQWTEILHAGNL